METYVLNVTSDFRPLKKEALAFSYWIYYYKKSLFFWFLLKLFVFICNRQPALVHLYKYIRKKLISQKKHRIFPNWFWWFVTNYQKVTLSVNFSILLTKLNTSTIITTWLQASNHIGNERSWSITSFKPKLNEMGWNHSQI